jgi:hypothetical protein
VRLVDDDRVVGAQLPVGVRLGEQHAVGHHLEDRVRAGLVLEADLVADEALGRPGELLGEAVREAARGDAPRLRAADETRGAALELEADLGKLRGLARPRLAADDRHRMLADEARDFVAVLRDRQVLRVGRPRHSREAGRAPRPRALDQVREQRLLPIRAAPLLRAARHRRRQRRDLRVVGRDGAGQEVGGKRGQINGVRPQFREISWP